MTRMGEPPIDRLFGYFKDRYGLTDEELASDPPLHTFIDSLGQLELLELLKKDLGVEVEQGDISADTFGTPARIARFVEGRRKR